MPPTFVHLHSLEVAVSRVVNVNPTYLICRDKLDGGGLRHDGALISDDMYVVATGIDKCHALRIRVGLAVGIVAFIFCHCSLSDDDQAMSSMYVPAGVSPRLPDIPLDIQV